MFSASLGITWVASKSLQFCTALATHLICHRDIQKKERVKCNLLLTKCPDDIDEKGNCISASPLVQVICNKKEVECSYFCCPLKLFLFCICLQFAQLMASALLFIILYYSLQIPLLLFYDLTVVDHQACQAMALIFTVSISLLSRKQALCTHILKIPMPIVFYPCTQIAAHYKIGNTTPAHDYSLSSPSCSNREKESRSMKKKIVCAVVFHELKAFHYI